MSKSMHTKTMCPLSVSWDITRSCESIKYFNLRGVSKFELWWWLKIMIEGAFYNDFKRILLWILLNTCLFHIVSAEKMKSCRKCSAKVTVEDRHVTDLTLYQHGHVHEHVVQLLDGGLQLDDVGVPSLDVRQGLLGRRRVHDDALGKMFFCHWYSDIRKSKVVVRQSASIIRLLQWGHQAKHLP